LIASYRVEDTSGEELWDEFGSLQAWLRGSPGRPTDSFFNNSRVLSLDGATQYALLDRTLGNLSSGTYGMWVNPTSSDADETLLYFGSSANTYLKLTGRDSNGFAHITISVNGTVQQLVSNVSVLERLRTAQSMDTFGGNVWRRYSHVLYQWPGRRQRRDDVPADRRDGGGHLFDRQLLLPWARRVRQLFHWKA
jgi:hypothetical protein